MRKPKRPKTKTSPAATQAEALADIDRIARAFHDAYEHLAPAYDYETRDESAVPWEQVPTRNVSLMQAVVASLLAQDVIRVGARPHVEMPIEGQTRLEDFLGGG
jgi:hypothetical protein